MATAQITPENSPGHVLVEAEANFGPKQNIGIAKDTSKWAKPAGDVMLLQSTLKELEDKHTDKELKELREGLDNEAKAMLQSNKGLQLKTGMEVKLYLENAPNAEENSWEMQRCDAFMHSFLCLVFASSYVFHAWKHLILCCARTLQAILHIRLGVS